VYIAVRMNVLSENIITHLFHQPSLEKVPLEQIQQITGKHPSFAVAQFLLLKKMQAVQHPDFIQQLQKTALYFNNPLWLEFLLTKKEEIFTGNEYPAGSLSETSAAANVNTNTMVDSHSATETAPPLIQNEPLTENEPEEEAQADEEKSNEDGLVSTEPMPSSPLADELKKLAAEIKAAKEIAPVANETTPDVPAFEPYHTIDYFASQGIKLEKIDQNPQDKFGRQLKSFTEWIKTMKRLPQRDLQKKLEQNDDSKVIADAAISLQEKEVVTEAMAEVYEKQGMREKAEGIYLKLSLLNPDKSHYFAAKIDALKQ
jgi:hypothetical protein